VRRAISCAAGNRSNRPWKPVSVFAHGTLIEARARTTALLREIAGQGPEKTLRRGFAIVRDAAGAPLTAAAEVKPGAAVELEFRDGRVAARANKGKPHG
jgi:exodeoxyribonuclease VII large subunit